MSDLRDLYQEVILDHSKRPRNFRRIDPPASEAHGHNPLCGDQVAIYLAVDGEVVRDASFQGSGCAISTASASMMTEAIRGKTVVEAKELADRFHALLAGPEGTSPEGLGKLAVFAGVREYPVRVKCATLAWHTMRAALERRESAVSTE